MAERVFLKPASPDLKVRIPDQNRYLDPNGEELELTYYFRRIIADGDVVIVQQTATDAPRSKKSTNSGE
mgnify:CR=1 FL=1